MEDHVKRLEQRKAEIENQLIWNKFVLHIYNEKEKEDDDQIIKDIRKLFDEHKNEKECHQKECDKIDFHLYKLDSTEAK